MFCRKNWTNRRRMVSGCGLCPLLVVLLVSGCLPPKPSGTVYVPQVDELFFVAPGDLVTDANGLRKAQIPYKGLIMSNQAYLKLLEPTHE